MGTDDVRFFCYFDGDFIHEDTNFKYIAGKTKLIKVPKSIGFSSFKQKIQEITKLPTQFQIKCGVPADESTVIPVDVDDDESLQSVLEDSKYVKTYILPATTVTAAQREDPILLLSATQSQSKIPIDGTSNNPVKINTIVVKTPGNDGMIKKKAAQATEDKLTEWFPEKLVSSVTGFENPLGDGNCGFRALCMTLRKNQNEWAWMRGKLLEQIESNNNFYNMLFGTEQTCELVQGIGHVEGPAPLAKWLDMPSTGFVFAQEFNVVLVHYSTRSLNCWTFIPFLSPPNADDVNVKVLGIGFLEKNQHYIKLDLGDGCPLPPIPFLWKTSHPEIAASWERLLAPRFNAFIERNVPELQVDKYQGAMMILDGVSLSNIDDHDIPALAENLLDVSDISLEGISSRVNKMMISLMGNHEHSEGSEVNMPEKWYVKSNVDDHQIILSGSSHSSTLDKMLYEANQASSQVSRCSQSSVPYQLSIPLIRNQEDNEADKGNKQESVVVEEIQFTFQRKETIISSHRSVPMPTRDRVDTSVRYSNSKVVPLDKGMTNMSVSNYEVNVGHENMVSMENVYTCQMEETEPLPVCIQTSSRVGLSDNDFDIEREYDDIEAFRNSLSDWAVKTGHEYKPARKTPSELKMKCVSEGCKWYISVSKLPNLSTFKVVKYEGEHSCLGPQHKCGGGDHRQATIKWIVSKMKSSIEKDPEIEPMKIVNEIKNQFGVNISYNKAVKAKTKVIEEMRNHRDPIPMLAKELEQNGSVVKVGCSSDGSFQHFFWSFQACIDALRNHLRPVVYVGSVDTEIGVLMFAQGVDGNTNGLCGDPIEVGFAVCVREDESSWERYLGWLKEFVLPPPTAAAAGIPFSIVTKFEKTSLTRAVENVLPHLHHFFDSYSFARVLSEKFKGNDLFLYTLCRYACRSFSTEKCEENLQAIKSENKEAYSWLMSVGSRSHWAIAFSPNKHALAVSCAFEWEIEEEFKTIGENWSIVERSRDRVAKYFSNRQSMGEEAARTTGLTPVLMRCIQRLKSNLHLRVVISIDGHTYQVRERVAPRDPYEWPVEVVDLEEKSCTCGEFQATEYPCQHAMKVIVHLDLDIRNYLGQHQWYSVDAYLKTYAGKLPPPIPDHILGIPLLPPKKNKVGRPRKFKVKRRKTI